MNPPQLFPLPKAITSAIAGIFPDLCTIQAPLDGASDQDAYGAPHGTVQRQYQDLAGHTDIQCAVAPEGGASAAASSELRRLEFTMEWNKFEIVLNGYFPAIKQTMQAVVTDPSTNTVTTYEIQGVNSDVYHLATHLHCRILTV